MTLEDADSGERIRPSKVMSRTVGGILWLLVAVSLLVVMKTGPAGKDADKKTSQGDELVKTGSLDIEQDDVKLVPRKVADFSLIERSGKKVTNKDLLGKPWCVNFIFTSCTMTCPTNTKAMMELSHACKDLDVRFVTITVDPERDTPERLQQYAEIYQADPEKWLFLTGDQQEIFDLIRNSFLQVVEKRKESPLFGMEFAHSDRVMQVDADGMIVGTYLLTDPKQVAILRRVLEGKMEIPEENRFLVPENLPNRPNAKNETPAEKNESVEKTEIGEVSSTAATPKKEKEKNAAAPDWLLRLPALNAILNGCALILLLIGYRLIRRGKREAHKKTMLLAFVVSIAFLGSYSTYHWGLHHYTGASSRTFPDIGFVRQVYLSILFSHIILAALVPFLSVITIYLGLKGNWEKHRFWAQVTFPIWLYVSATGVIIYVMLYHIAGA